MAPMTSLATPWESVMMVGHIEDIGLLPGLSTVIIIIISIIIIIIIIIIMLKIIMMILPGKVVWGGGEAESIGDLREGEVVHLVNLNIIIIILYNY